MQSQRGVTDASGRLSFDAESAIMAQFQVSRQGFRSEDNLDTARITARRDSLANVTVGLVPQSVITGRVVNGDGEALDGITVEAVRIDIVNGRQQLRESYAAKATDDRGEFRFWNILPGSYYLRVAGREATFLNDTTNLESYGPIYFPSSPRQETAQVLRVEPGKTINASFRLEPHKAYQIRGKILSGPPTGPLRTRLIRGEDSSANRTLIDLFSRTFQVLDVTPGVYTLQVYTSDDSPIWFGETTLDVGDRDLTGATLVMNRGVDVHGAIESAGDPEGFPVIIARRLGLAAPPAALEVVSSREQDGSISLKGLIPGKYSISVSGYLGRQYVSSVVAGSTDVLADGLTVLPSGTPELKITLMPGAGTIAGKIDGASLQDETWTLLLVGRNGDGRTYRTEQVYGNMFNIAAFAPGEYAVYVWPTARPLEFRNPSVLSTFSQYAAPVKVASGENEAVILKPIPKEALP